MSGYRLREVLGFGGDAAGRGGGAENSLPLDSWWSLGLSSCWASAGGLYSPPEYPKHGQRMSSCRGSPHRLHIGSLPSPDWRAVVRYFHDARDRVGQSVEAAYVVAGLGRLG